MVAPATATISAGGRGSKGKDVDSWIRAVSGMIAKDDDAIYKVTVKFANLFAQECIEHVPVEWGILKASIRGQWERSTYEITGAFGTNEIHGVYTEFGTHRPSITGRPVIVVGTPEHPRTTWPAKEATHTMSHETMPWMRPAWLAHVDELNAAYIAVGVRRIE